MLTLLSHDLHTLRFPLHRSLRHSLTYLLLLSFTSVSWAGNATEEIIVHGDQHNLPHTIGDSAELLKKQGVEFYSAGGVAKLPVLRGMNDDRVKLLIDGAETTSACANHMNPALSYIDASRVKVSEVLAGITPVSVGGDSIAGTIVITSETPRYAETANALLTSGFVTAFYKSNAREHAEAFNAILASDKLSLEYTGSRNEAKSYRDGNDNKVLDTLYRTESHNLTLGVKGEQQELIVKVNHHEVPYQGFPNQYMDMVDNTSDGININYLREQQWGQLDARITWQQVAHEMGFFTEEKTGAMPMFTEGKDVGYKIKLALPMASLNTDNQQPVLSLGHEYHQFKLADWWPAMVDSMMMGPDDFININNGEKTRAALWAELEQQISSHWLIQTGIRYEHVVTDTGDVQPYNTMSSMMMPNLDAPAADDFNSRLHKQTNDNVDLTLLARYHPTSSHNIEFGYARKTRTPNLYERYSWGRNTMAMTMLGWFGDGNAYVGDIDLKPEIAHTLSATFNWRATTNESWELSATPYYSYVDDYIDVVQIGTFNPRNVMSVTRPKLQFTNVDADFYGLELKTQYVLWHDVTWGRGNIKSAMAYTRGQRHDGSADLYHIMPLNINLTLEHIINNWTNTLAVQWVDKKDRVDTVRQENMTDSYSLVDIGTRVTLNKLTLSLDVRNLFNEDYELPLGGISIAQWRAANTVGGFNSLPGQGRSIDIGVRYQF